MIWDVIYTHQAELDLRGIFEYIAYSLQEPDIAGKQTARLTKAIDGLDNMPLRHSLYDKEPWHSRGLRFMTVDNYLVFYLPVEQEKTVAVIRIMYGGRDVDAQLEQSET